MKFLQLTFLFLIFGCSHALHMVHLSDHDVQRSAKAGKKITAQAEQKVIFHFVFDTKFAELAKQRLIAKCPNGEIKNIMTRYSTSHGFFHWTNKILMEGRCFK